MCKRTMCLMSLVLLVGFVGNVYGITTTWEGAPPVDPNFPTYDQDWFNPDNWNAGVPTSVDWADIYEYAYAFPDITSGTAETGTLRINSSVDGVPSLATVTVSGGNLDCHKEMYISYGTAGKDGELIVNSGSVRTGVTTGSDWLMVGADQSYGYLTINGGSVETEWVGIPRWWTFSGPPAGGVVTLNGGELRVGTGFIIDAAADKALINIAGGTLIWNGDHVGEIETMQTAGQITGHNFHVGIIVDYDITNPLKTTVTAEPFDPEKASTPYPVDGGAVLGAERQSTILTWEAGINADPSAHEVYFSDNFDDVNDLNPAVMTIRNATNFDPGPLLFGQTYYWRVVEVNAPDSWVGDVWEFSVDDYIAIDDFESYDDANDLITGTWVPDSSTVSLAQDIVRGDAQSMKLSYSGAASATTRTFAASQDWTVEGLKALVLYFYGAEGNTGILSVKIEDADGDVSPTVSYPNSGDLGLLGWAEFNIDLVEFNVGNVDLNKIKKITISVNDGSGAIYIDDIRVYISRCVPDLVLTDLTGDCITDIDDLVFLCDRWLISGYDVTPSAPSVGPHVWYKFDDGSGSTVLDSSGNGYDGTVSFPPTAWVSSGCPDGGCINFDGWYVVYVDPSAFTPLNPNEAMTLSLWVKGNGNNLPVLPGESLHYGILLHAGAADWEAASEVLRVTCPQTSGDGSHQVSFYTRPSVDEGPNLETINFETSNPDDWSDLWVHYAFVKDTPNSAMRIYRNGELMSENIDAGLPMGFDRDPANFKFSIGGARADVDTTSYRGQVDDFRLYDYALSPAEVLHLAGTGSFTQSLWEPHAVADISGDEKISLPDFAMLATAWLDVENVWP